MVQPSPDIDLSLWCSRLPKVAAGRIRELEAEVARLTAALSDQVVVPKEPTDAMLRAAIGESPKAIWQAMTRVDSLQEGYERGLKDAIKTVRQGRDDFACGQDIGRLTNAILDVAEGRIKDLAGTRAMIAAAPPPSSTAGEG